MNGKWVWPIIYACIRVHLLLEKNQAIKTLEKVDQAIKTLEKVDHAIKQASRDESNDQAFILTIKFLDHRRRWKYRVHGSEYPWHGHLSPMASSLYRIELHVAKCT